MNCSDDLCVQQNNILLKHMSFMVPRPRQDRAWSGPSMPRLSPNAAVQALLDVGILKKPNLCPKCNQGTLQGPWPRHDAKESEQRYWVCDFSSSYTSVLSGSGGFAQRFRTLSPLCPHPSSTSFYLCTSHLAWSDCNNVSEFRS